MEFITVLCLFLVFVYFLSKFYHSFWSRRGIKQLNPKFLLGDAAPMLTLRESFGEFFANLYQNHKNHRLIGIYITYLPVVIVNDTKLAQDILIKDFNTFHDRPMPVDEINDPLSGHLFSLGGKKWKDLRVKLSPTFTSGKLKAMLPIVKDCGQVLEIFLMKKVNNGDNVIEFRDLLARYSINIISSVAFGIDNDCINEPETNCKNGVKGMVQLLMPSLFHKLKLKTTDKELEDFMFSIVKQTVEYREKTNFTRNDFMQSLIQLTSEGFVEPETGEIKKLKLTEMVAQVFVFFAAGYETTSSTLAYCLLELSRHPEMQRKVQEEIDEAFQSTASNDVTFETLEKLNYVDCCINETLRKYPVAAVLLRKCKKDYKVRDSEIVIAKGTAVFLPIMGYHRDPEIYEKPLEFRPERFLDSSNGNGHADGLFYLPFGDGPRICIGMRLAKLTTKIGLAIMLRKFNFTLTDESLQHQELKFSPNQITLTPLELFSLKIEKRLK